MKSILVTGSKGFVGKNLIEGIARLGEFNILTFNRGDSQTKLRSHLRECDIIYHLAGENRPKNHEEYNKVNVGLARDIVQFLEQDKRCVPIVFTSSIQAGTDNCYGKSKYLAEQLILNYSSVTETKVYIFRMPNLFGKWCKPNYNSVVATFCYNISRELPINISNRKKDLNLLYIDDLINIFIDLIAEKEPIKKGKYYEAYPVFNVNLGELVDMLTSFFNSRKTLILPDLSDPFTRRLFATYISYLPEKKLSYSLKKHEDERGFLFEIFKSNNFGQIFISRSFQNIFRGNHYHNNKVEKFVVLEGTAIIRLRNILKNNSVEYLVSGRYPQTIDIPPGYSHSIENVGEGELLVLFWASEIFNPTKSDTYPFEV